MRRCFLALAVVAALPTAAAGQSDPPAEIARGKQVAVSYCRGCHLIATDDLGPVPDGVPSFMAIATMPRQTAEGVSAALLGRHPIMPASPLTAQQASDVSAYIMSLAH